jgi:hypothetical protein
MVYHRGSKYPSLIGILGDQSLQDDEILIRPFASAKNLSDLYWLRINAIPRTILKLPLIK